jgi:hypothetical protein
MHREANEGGDRPLPDVGEGCEKSVSDVLRRSEDPRFQLQPSLVLTRPAELPQGPLPPPALPAVLKRLRRQQG